MAYNPADWHDFYVMTGGAAAALTGLLFVAMSLHAKAIMENRFYSDRAIGTLMSLASQLILSGAVLIPGQPLWLLGVEVEVAALFFLVTTTRTVRARRTTKAPVVMRFSHMLLESVGGAAWIVLFVAAGISLTVGVGGGLYLLAVVMFFMFAWNIYIAWTLITEVSEAG